MSYAEHGPRIFLANKSNAGTPLIYGDYVLPKKRLEGRLKLYDSCSDIRAWSPNYLENSRYFRELNEHSSPIGRIIPLNVVIDNIIQLNSQTQNELQIVKKELEKYKSIKLSPKQEQELQGLENAEEKDSLQNDNGTMSFLKDTFVNISKSVPIINSNSCLSIHIPFKRHFQSNIKDKSTLRHGSNEVCSYSLTAFDPSLNNYNLIPSFQTVKLPPTEDFSEKPSPWIEYVDVAVQVEIEPCNLEKIDNQMDKYFDKTLTSPAMSQTSFAYKYSDEDKSITELESISSQTNNDKDQSFECNASCSEGSQNIEIPTESCNGIHEIYKEIIIQKDSEIIALGCDLRTKDAELKELRDIEKNLNILLKEKEDCINTQQENLKILHDKLLESYHQHNYQIEDIMQQLHDYKYLIDQLRQDLNAKSETCYLQSQEIEKLRLSVKDVAALQLEKNSFLKKIQEMEDSIKKAETCNLTSEQIKSIIQERDELKKQNYEQSCILADQEEEIKQLLILIKEKSVAYEEQKKTKSMLENLKTEIQNKDIKISQYEEQLILMKQEISDLFNNLKRTLNNLEELNESCEEVCNCTNCDLDINEEANNLLQNLNIIMTRFQSYKIESQNLSQQIKDLKQYAENNKQQIHANQNLRNTIVYEDFYNESHVDFKDASNIICERDNIIAINIRQNTSNTNEIEFEGVSNSINNENSEVSDSLNFYKHGTECHNYIIKLNKETNKDEIEKEIVECFSDSPIKLHSLSPKLRFYVEIERPFMIKLIYNFHKILKNIQSTINNSQDISSRKQQIFKLYNQHKEECTKYNSYSEEVPAALSRIQNEINEFIEAILHQLLNEILCAEKENLHNKQINDAFEMYFKSCIDRINSAFEGAGDQHVQIAKEIEKQQEELQKKDTEIAHLKEEVAQYLARRGEGDCLNRKELEKSTGINAKLTAELNNKTELILKLEDQLRIITNDLFAYKKNCKVLKTKNKNFYNIKNKVLKECQQTKKRLAMKNREIENLSQQLRNLSEVQNSNTNMKNRLMEVEKELIDIQLKNNKLEEQVLQTNLIISKKDEAIIDLKNSVENNENTLSKKIEEYENVMKEKDCEIVKLENENKALNEKVKDTENKLIKMNQTITSLTEQTDKINIITTMQEDLVKLDKNEKKLKAELSNLKVQLIDDQNNNKKLDNSLDMCLHENENLQKSVEYWKNENSELSVKLCNEIIEEKLKSQLHALSNKIYERLSTLKKRFNSEEIQNHQFNENLLNKYTIHQDQVVSLPPLNHVHENLKSKCKDQERELKENEIEDVELQELLNIANIKRNINAIGCTTFKQLESSENNSNQMKYETNSSENEHYENQNKTEKLLNEIEIRNCKIRNYMQIIKRLTEENTDLRAVIKSQAEKYQNKLTLLKKNYDSSLNAITERHKESVEILQKQFEDNLRNESIFDSENWLQSLNMKELMELYERISIILNSNSSLMCTKSKNQCFYENNAQKEFYTKINEADEKLQMTHKDICERGQSYSRLQSQWPVTTSSDINNYSIIQTQDVKPNARHDIRYSYYEEKPPELENKYGKEKKVVKDNAFDQQRWNFINQCSAYHKLGNTNEYSRITHTD